jgi:hypothetical protein
VKRAQQVVAHLEQGTPTRGVRPRQVAAQVVLREGKVTRFIAQDESRHRPKQRIGV